MNDFNVIKQHGDYYIDSREVAKFIGKPHMTLLRDIDKCIKYMNISTNTEISLDDFFILRSCFDNRLTVRSSYLITRKGCNIVACVLPSDISIKFITAYSSKFDEAESEESEPVESKPLPPQLGEYNAATRIIVSAMKRRCISDDRIMEFVKGVYEPLGFTIISDEELSQTPTMYTAEQIAYKLGMYSMYGNPHSQAVSCLLNEVLCIHFEHKKVITSDYGTHIGISVRYDVHAVNAVIDWLMINNRPGEIDGYWRTYYVRYR